eukprot:1159368-Pelagomonas_calceolata.AAC.6
MVEPSSELQRCGQLVRSAQVDGGGQGDCAVALAVLQALVVGHASPQLCMPQPMLQLGACPDSAAPEDPCNALPQVCLGCLLLLDLLAGVAGLQLCTQLQAATGAGPQACVGAQRVALRIREGALPAVVATLGRDALGLGAPCECSPEVLPLAPLNKHSVQHHAPIRATG